MKRSSQAIFILLLGFSNSVLAQVIPCADVLQLVQHSASGFSSIKGEVINEGFKSTKLLPEADYCLIFEDPEKRTFMCAWEFAIGSKQASLAFEKNADRIGDCLGSGADRQTDQAVNHPDTYRSHLYKLSESEARLTLKNKSALMSTIMSFLVDTSR